MIALYTLMEGIIAFFLIAGSIFALIGSLGLARMKDFYMRLHGPSKISTLGVGCVLLASIAYFSLLDGGPSLRELLITIFLFITAPVSAHLLSKSALHQKLERDPRTRGNPEELQEDDDERTLEETPQGSSKLP
ncbi:MULTISPECIES: Na+/H+ antiporter subunit G [Chromohalobacter]|uniref:Na+/H+ antiporter subunit G n=2 Tax=Chromohalobacter TaxID=42054 RepID=A0A1Q8T9F8_9GAMM|nr:MULTISPECIES: Na+/H+ antiporter subunit G [Chromohalobacter]MCK0752228.1 Na+/H+ antiporter subunit G [Chromohalobacter japonicus]MCK0764602.1 Na+/H+ antiporter subunit G [Chromohalobacter beijerinckii]OLO10320.1 Na+/H+ antiporter subunit G [Chromohalobacter japonicus]